MAVEAAVTPKSKTIAKPKAAAKPAAPAKAAAPAKQAVAPKAKAAPVITLKHLAAALAGQQEMPPKQVSLVLGGLVELMVDHLRQGDRLRSGGLGVLEVKSRPARMGRNPATGAA